MLPICGTCGRYPLLVSATGVTRACTTNTCNLRAASPHFVPVPFFAPTTYLVHSILRHLSPVPGAKMKGNSLIDRLPTNLLSNIFHTAIPCPIDSSRQCDYSEIYFVKIIYFDHELMVNRNSSTVLAVPTLAAVMSKKGVKWRQK